ncbi:hemerythrin domain-containing protein [Schlegelella sp. S2-27]|uniref:Hemerythrin domain-containing protein n=1 Tax=Caldimonas mangrovi TaxID=2944811 RepID=A0ABT0YID0_9BURK|nr:hemerythrin domain-containing protein [Caldimonas mangrovi]MCM5677957.1 hemerythrin domain-containing protein [Caldimonas mangrovi]
MARTNASSRSEVFEMLKEDHKRAKKSFRDFSKLEQEGDEQACQQLAVQTCKELQLHMRLEEEVFYPAARSGLEEEDLIEEAEVEHGSAKTLIEQLQTLSPDDPKFAATFTVLGEYIKHHVKEEEGEMFEQLGRSKIDWDGVLEEMLARRMELESELGLASEEADEQAAQAVPPEARGAAAPAQAKPAR